MCFFLFCGCSSLDKSLIKQNKAVEAFYESALDSQTSITEREVDWDEAMRLVFSNNLELKRARSSIENAHEQRAQIYWDLVPSLYASTSLRKSIGELGKINTDDLNFSLFSSVNIPGIVNLRSRYYAASLAIVRAEIARELKCREKVIQLRELFLRYAIFEQQKRASRYNQMLQKTRRQNFAALIDVTPALIDAEQEEYRLKALAEQIQEDIARMLGDYSHTWVLDYTTQPELDYVANPLNLEATDQYGILLRSDLAANLEALRLTEVSALLSFFPDLSGGLSAPPLYTVSNGQSESFSAEKIRARLSSGLSLDTRRKKAKRLDNVRERIRLQHEEIKVRIQGEIRRALLAQQELAMLDRDLHLVDLRIKVNERVRTLGSGSEGIHDALEKNQSLSAQAATLRLRKAAIEGVFWLLDDDWWINNDEINDLLEEQNEM